MIYKSKIALKENYNEIVQSIKSNNTRNVENGFRSPGIMNGPFKISKSIYSLNSRATDFDDRGTWFQ